MGKSCYTKLGDKHYSGETLLVLENKLNQRDKLIADRDNAKSGRVKRKYQNKIDKVESSMNDILSERGIKAAVDSNGNIDVKSIFADSGTSQLKDKKERILSKLMTLATSVRVTREEFVDVLNEVWNTNKADFQAANISIEEVSSVLKTIDDNEVLKRAPLADIDKSTNIGKVVKYFLGEKASDKTDKVINQVKDQLNKYGFQRIFPEIGNEKLTRKAKIEGLGTKYIRGVARLNARTNDINLNAVQRKHILEVLKGEVPFDPSIINDKAIKGIIEDVRLDFDVLSSALQKYGFKGAGTIEIIENNKGEYVTRTYEVFTNTQWADKLFKEGNVKGEAVIDNARPIIRKRVQKYVKKLDAKIKKLQKEASRLKGSEKADKLATITALEDQRSSAQVALSSKELMNDYIKSELESFAQSQRVNDVTKKEVTGRTKNAIFKKRNKELSPEIRALWGDMTMADDPFGALTQSIIQMTTQLGNSIYQSNVATIMQEQGLYTKSAADAKAKGWVPFDVKKGGLEVLKNILEGRGDSEGPMYMPAEIAELLESQYGSKSDLKGAAKLGDQVMQIVGLAGGAVKKNMTVYNLSGQGVNAMGNLSFAAASGKMLKKGYTNNLKRAFRVLNFANKEITENNKDFERLTLAISNNITGSSVELETARDFLDSELGSKIGSMFDKAKDIRGIGTILRGLEGTDKALSGFYEYMDAVWKFADFNMRLDEYANILGGVDFDNLTDPEIKKQVVEMSAQETRDEFPNYNETIEFVNNIRKSKLFGAFPSFAAEALRTRFKTLNRQINHIKGKGLPKGLSADAKAKIRAKAVTELGFNIAISHVLGAALPMIISGAFGNEEEEDLIRDEFLADWEGNGIIRIGEDGMYRVWQSGYYLPVGYAEEIVEPVIRSLTGNSNKPLLEAMGSSFGKFIEPYLGQDIIAGAVLELTNNQSKWGKDIVTSDDMEGGLTQLFDFTMKKVGGTVGQLYKGSKLKKALEDVNISLESDPTNKKLLQRRNLIEKKIAAKGGILTPYTVGLRYNVHKKEQDMTYAFLSKASGLAEKKQIFNARVSKHERDLGVLDKEFKYTESQYHKELEEAKELYERMYKIYPDVEYDKVFGGEYLLSTNKGSLDEDKKVFAKKEIAYITGRVSEPPPLELETYEVRKGPQPGERPKREKRERRERRERPTRR